jgi:hypothetical protein
MSMRTSGITSTESVRSIDIPHCPLAASPCKKPTAENLSAILDNQGACECQPSCWKQSLLRYWTEEPVTATGNPMTKFQTCQQTRIVVWHPAQCKDTFSHKHGLGGI